MLLSWSCIYCKGWLKVSCQPLCDAMRCDAIPLADSFVFKIHKFFYNNEQLKSSHFLPYKNINMCRKCKPVFFAKYMALVQDIIKASKYLSTFKTNIKNGHLMGVQAECANVTSKMLVYIITFILLVLDYKRQSLSAFLLLTNNDAS